MQFMMMYRPDKNSLPAGPPSREYLDEMDKLIAKARESGELLATGGLEPSSKGARVRLSGGKLSVTDGPFTEAKELIAGFALMQLNSKEEAIESAKRFLEVAGEGECDLRPLMETPDCAR